MERKWKGIWLKKNLQRPHFKEDSQLPYFRGEFTVPKGAKRIVVYLCGLGFHQLYINGALADDRFYAPCLSQYDFHAGYVEYDVSALVKEGQNAVVVQLGDGFYNCRNQWKYTVNFSSWREAPCMICDVEVDGEVIACSGSKWRVKGGPIVRSCHHEGEIYDARLELPREAFLPGYDDSAWDLAAQSLPPGGRIVKEEGEPCRIIRRYDASEMHDAPADTPMFDLGQNIAGVAELELEGEAGTVLDIRYGEMLDDKGQLDRSGYDMGIKECEADRYIMKGGGKEVWHPTFVWHGFRYVEIRGAANVKIHRVTGLFIATDMKSMGNFTSSVDVLNKVQEITLNSYLGNFMGIPTDCPTREKFGWTGDAACALEVGLWNFDCTHGLDRLARIISDLQRPDGNFPTHGPTTLWGFGESNPGYSRYMYDFCYMNYLFRGDDAPMRRYYDALRKGMDFFEEISREDNLIRTFGYGDWCNPDYFPGNKNAPTRSPVAIESCFWFTILKEMSYICQHLGHEDDARHYTALAQDVKEAILGCFYNAEDAIFDEGFWSSTALALNAGVIPEQGRASLAAKLVEDVRRNGHKCRFGIVGAQCMQVALSEAGYASDAYRMAVQPEYPGWGNLVARGATTLWEMWAGNASCNHIMMGGVSAWMYRCLAGMYPIEPGFSRIRLAPALIPELEEVSATHETPLGTLSSKWVRDGRQFRCTFQVPKGAVAEVRLPGVSESIQGNAEYVVTVE